MNPKKEIEAKIHDIESDLTDLIVDAQSIIYKAKKLQSDLVDVGNMVIALETKKEEE